MGKQNRQRRAMKQREHHKRSAVAPPGRPSAPGEGPLPLGRDHPARGNGASAQTVQDRSEPTPFTAAEVASLLRQIARARTARERSERTTVLDALALPAGPATLTTIDAALALVSGSSLAGLWEDGWQPVDLVRLVGQRSSSAHSSFVVDAIAHQARDLALGAAPALWRSQLDSIGAKAWWDEGATHLEQWRIRSGLALRTALGVAVEVLSTLLVLPTQPRLCPPPSAWSTQTSSSRAGGLDLKVLTKVRALLAKAESTEFPDEAESLSAKAQELIARHAIDRALLDAADPGATTPDGRRVPVEDPYASGKATLLQEIASANRCRAVWSKAFSFCTVFGFAGDLDAVELLHTSLLVQATAAMVAAGPQVDDDGVTRTRSFRSSFLAAFAHRIGERLRQATAANVSAAVDELGDGRLLPVLAAREDAVSEVVAKAFPRLVSRRAQAVNRAGWIAGRVAADGAELAVGPHLTNQRRLSA